MNLFEIEGIPTGLDNYSSNFHAFLNHIGDGDEIRRLRPTKRYHILPAPTGPNGYIILPDINIGVRSLNLSTTIIEIQKLVKIFKSSCEYCYYQSKWISCKIFL